MGKPTIWFPHRSDINQAVQSQKMARGFKFGFKKKRECTIHIAKTKALCVFVFAYADCWFSHVTAQISQYHVLYLTMHASESGNVVT